MNIITIGGGTAHFHVLRAIRGFASLHALKGLDAIEITAIPVTTDSGGSTGVLRREHGVVAPGDISQCVSALYHNVVPQHRCCGRAS